MLPTFVIGLREGLEAALIVGIIAAFLRKQGRGDLLRATMAGVGLAVVLCLGAGIALDAYSSSLPQKQQEGLETVIGILAVGMVTYMVVWMRRHSRDLKGSLETLAAQALTGPSGAGRAMVLMAFLAVIREGVETVVFLLAAFNEAGNPRAAGLGVVLGVAVAVVLGYAIYRGGVRINLSRFFRATGAVLVLVAAGIVVNAVHTAHEAGWLDIGQGRTVDLTRLVRPGSVQASLLTGMLGIQAHPVVAEVVAWLLYLVPVGLYVVWPPGRSVSTRLTVRLAGGVAAVAAVAALVLALGAPDAPARRPVTTDGAITAQVVARDAGGVTVRTQEQSPLTGATGAIRDYRLVPAGAERVQGVAAERYTVTAPGSGAAGRPAALSAAQVAALNGGRLPLSVTRTAADVIPVTYQDRAVLTVRLEPRTDRVLDVAWRETVTASVRTAGDAQALSAPVASAASQSSSAALERTVAAARVDGEQRSERATRQGLAAGAAVVAVLAAGVAAATGMTRRRAAERVADTAPERELVSQ